MTLTTTLHVNFRGQAEEALTFYHSVFGGDLIVVRYGDLGADAPGQEGQEGQVVWGQVRSADGFHLMAYDVQDALPYEAGTNPFYLSLRSTQLEQVRVVGEALAAAEGTTVLEPFGPAVFSPWYGKLTDRFGVTWIIDVEAPRG